MAVCITQLHHCTLYLVLYLVVPAYDMSYSLPVVVKLRAYYRYTWRVASGEWRVVSHAFMRDECCGTSTVYTSRGEQASYYQVKDEKS